MVAMLTGGWWHMSPWWELALALPVQIAVGQRFYRGAYRSLKGRAANMDVLVALGTSAAFLYSLGVLIQLGSGAAGLLYFEASVLILTLVLTGKALENRAKRATSEAIRALVALRPDIATRLVDGVAQEVPVADLKQGDLILVKPGGRVPVDGTITSGASDFDESLITGESMPVTRRTGDKVLSGTLSVQSAVEIEALAVDEDTTLARIIRLVEAAQGGKAPIQRLVDQISAIFVPVVMALAVITFLGWSSALAPTEAALIAAVSVLVIACPCALGLATPTALVAGMGAAARAGILIRDIDALEIAHRVDTVVLDKTGTLTLGQPEVRDVVPYGMSGPEVLALASAVQRNSEHPLAAAVLAAAADLDQPKTSVADFRNHLGQGVSGRLDGTPVGVGNRALMEELGADTGPVVADLERLEARADTVVFVARGSQVVGLIAISDTLRPQSVAAVAALQTGGIKVVMLTGDNENVAGAIAGQLSIADWHARVRPNDKKAHIDALRKAGRIVAMIGDGVNDAPALAAADIGIAMGSGADVAMETAGITLMRPNPMLIVSAFDVSRATWKKIRQNLFWAFIYNVVGIPLAMVGLLSPAIAGAAMAMSSVSVVTNSLLLRRWRSFA
jgi:Cu+-exporting ATPase